MGASQEIDWNEMAKTFDRWLPLIQPVADKLISLAGLSSGQEVLDVASGTGEPSLTIARRFGNQIQLTGVDGAEAMVAVANGKREQEGLQGVTFQLMKAEHLAFPAERFDRVLSRFGVMLFDDPPAGLSEMRRVLRQGGKMAIGVWGEFHRVQSIYLIWEPLMRRFPEQDRLPTPKMADLGPPGKLEALLHGAGFNRFEIIPFSLTYDFDDFESYWKTSTESGVLKDALGRLSQADQEGLKNEVTKATALHQRGGRIKLQNEVLLALATK